MLTLFALPKGFSGHTEIIQRNAFKSWKALGPNVEIIIFGDDPGVAETSAEFGFKHVKDVKSSNYGTPLVDDIFNKAEAMASFDIMCYVNADIILTPDILQGAAACEQAFEDFLMVSQRWDLDVNKDINFNNPDWQMKLRARVVREGNLHRQSGIDYFLYNKGIYKNIPPFAVGRLAWDNWLVREARESGYAVVDATEAVFIVHQNHDYNHAPGGHAEVWKGEEQKLNKQLANMTWGGPGYIQNASTWRLLPWRFIPANKADLPNKDFNPEAYWMELIAKVTPMIESQKFDQALAELDQSRELVQHLEDYHYIRGVTYAHMGKKAKAIQACREAMRINPGSPHARQLIETLGGDASTPWAETQKTEPAKQETVKQESFEAPTFKPEPLKQEIKKSEPLRIDSEKKAPEKQNIQIKKEKIPCKQHSDFGGRLALFTEMVMLEDNDFRDKKVLEIGSGKRENFPFFQAASKVVSLRPEGHDSSNDEVRFENQISCVNSSICALGKTEKFERVVISDLDAYSNNPSELASQLFDVMESDALLVIAAMVKETGSTFDMYLLKHFERFFLVQLEEHFEIQTTVQGAMIKPYRYEVIDLPRPGVILGKLQRARQSAEIKEPSPPFEIDGRIYAVDHKDLIPGRINRAELTTKVDEAVKTLESDVIGGLDVLKKQINNHYEDVALKEV